MRACGGGVQWGSAVGNNELFDDEAVLHIPPDKQIHAAYVEVFDVVFAALMPSPLS
jgi:hypothetical protein